MTSISCVISCYNYERYLEFAVDSALAQTVPFDRIIVVDDGSTDNSFKRLQSYGARIVAESIANSGQTGACLHGLRQVESDYVYFLDADDFIPADFVARVLPLLVDRPVKLQFQLRSVTASGEPTPSAFPTYPVGYDVDAMREDNAVLGFYRSPPTSGLVFSTRYLRSLSLEKLNPRGAIDSTVNLVAPYFGEVVSVNEALSFYRVHGSSLSGWSNPSPELLEKEVDIFRATWREAFEVAGIKQPETSAPPVYMLERRLMKAALQGRFWIGGLAFAYIRRLRESSEPRRQKLQLIPWALALIVPVRGLRSKLIRIRRSSANRPAWLNRLVALVNRGRLTVRSTAKKVA